MDQSVRQTIPFISKPHCFSGIDWDSYKIHFTACVAANHWSAAEAVNILRAKLVGDAALVLAQKRMTSWTYIELIRALDDRYSITGPVYILKSKLRGMYQQPGKSIQAYGDALTTLVAGKLDSFEEEQRVVLEQFIEGLYHGHTSKSVTRKQPPTLREAITWHNNTNRCVIG